MQRHRVLALLSLVALTAGPILLLSSSAGADVTGPCTATMNGVDVNTIDTPGTALEVPSDGTVSIEVTSSAKITSHSVRLEPIGGLGFTASEGTDDGNGWSGTVKVADYAKYGVGIYKVIGSATGPGACSGTGFVKITGKSPLSTAAGAAGAALTAIGAVGGVASSLRIRGKVRHDKMRHDSVVFGGLMSAFALSVAYMVSGAGTPGVAPLRPTPSRMRASTGGVISGLLFGLGTLVLAQQFAVFYPTIPIAIGWLVICMLLFGFVLPSLVGLTSVRDVNARPGQLAPAPQPGSVWTPTHRAPAEGLDAWPAPDPASGQPTRLDPGLDLRVEQTVGDWAQVRASNGWTGWVDGRRLMLRA